jgi:hypothetical protein
MAKKSFKKPNYKTAVSKNVEKMQSEGSSFGYMNLPKGVDIFKEPKGRVTVDIIPYVISDKFHADLDKEAGIEVGVLWYKKPFKVHRQIGAGNGDTVVCPSTFGKPCPICEHRKKRMAEGADKDEIKALATSKRNLYAVIPIGVKDFDEKIHIWNTTDYFVQELINKELEEQEDKVTFPDLEEGYSLKFRFDEESFAGHKYTKPSRLDFEDRDPYDEDILDEVPDLDKCLKVLPYAELEAMLFQIDPEDVDETTELEDEQEEKPARRRKTVIEDEDTEEEEKPARRKKVEAPEESEEEDAEEEEDEELEIPEGCEICPACNGTGMNARGRTCIACKGLGYIEIEEEEPEEKPVKKEDTQRAKNFKEEAKKRGVKLDEEEPKTKISTKNKCPFGHKWGKDNDAFPKDCKKCTVWDDCFDAQ